MTANPKTWVSEGSGTTFFQVLEEKNCQPSTYSVLEKYLSQMKGKLRCSQMKKTEFVASKATLKE